MAADRTKSPLLFVLAVVDQMAHIVAAGNRLREVELASVSLTDAAVSAHRPIT